MVAGQYRQVCCLEDSFIQARSEKVMYGFFLGGGFKLKTVWPDKGIPPQSKYLNDLVNFIISNFENLQG